MQKQGHWLLLFHVSQLYNHRGLDCSLQFKLEKS